MQVVKATSEEQRRIAVVGSGMAGLVIAHLLHRDPRSRYRVTVFESSSQPALDGSSVTIKGSLQRIDVPMRAFAGGYYKNLRAMYDWMGVQYHAQRFLFFFSALRSQCLVDEKGHLPEPLRDRNVHFIHSSNNHRIPPLKPPHVSFLFFTIETIYLLLCYSWFTICCFVVKDRPNESFGEYAERIKLPRRFMTQYLFPLISSVATCSGEELERFPASDVVNYKISTTGQSHFVLTQGMREVQTILTGGLDIILVTRVLQVKRSGSGVAVALQNATSDITVRDFDEVVLAVPPNVVGQILPDLSRPMLKIPTTEVQTVVYASPVLGKGSDQPNMTPARIAAYVPQVIHFRISDRPQKPEAIHYQSPDVCVVTNPLTNMAGQLATHSSTFTRVLRTAESRRIVNKYIACLSTTDLDYKSEKHWKNGDDGIWVAGGWAWDGMVLLEGCMVSALKVADGLGVEVPWR